jgi:lysophospholipase L1-like esterase
MCAENKSAGANIITNLAVPGSTAREALTTKKLYANGVKNFAEHIAASPANIVICNWAINDNFVVGHTSLQLVADYLELKATVAAAGKTFIAETPNPLKIYNNGVLNTVRNQMIAQYAAALLEAGRSYNIPVMDTFTAVSRWYPDFGKNLQDGVHPDAIMYGFIGQYVYRFLDEGGYLAA